MVRHKHLDVFGEDIINCSDSCYSPYLGSPGDDPSSGGQVVDPWRVGRRRPLEPTRSWSCSAAVWWWVCVGCPDSSCHYMPMCGRGGHAPVSDDGWWLMAASITQSNVPWPLPDNSLRDLTVWSTRRQLFMRLPLRALSANNASKTSSTRQTLFYDTFCLPPVHYKVRTPAGWRKL